ncbi:MAG: YHS domain-containing protein [Chloroflexota bacterium]
MGTAIDPVCGMEVQIEGCPHTLEYKGVTYHFCAKGCLLEFRDDPEKYLDPAYVPSM